jgi:hypothetical protein
LAAFWGVANSASAKDYFVTVGGGYSVVGNQLSLERNVAFQQTVLAEQRPDEPSHDVFFADGEDEMRDVQCRVKDFKASCPTARRMMAELFGDGYAIDLYYRNHELEKIRDGADLATVRKRFRQLARELKAGDRLIIYLTGHGGPAVEPEEDYDDEEYEVSDDEPETPYNKFDTSFYFWDSESVAASEFTRWLDRFDRDVEIVLVMVQCYAGGFAHTIFQQADEEMGLAGHARCGFFGQRHDRGAAGCTPDADESDYEEYSSYFWAALNGKTRSGKEIDSADYDGDGKTSFAEAHTYAIIESDTIDVPVRTSSALLAKYSHLGKPKAAEGEAEGNVLGKMFGLLETTKPVDGKQPAELKGPLKDLAKRARPEQRAILEQLPAKLSLSDAPTVEEVQQKIGQVGSNRKVAQAEYALALRAYHKAHSNTQEEVREIWPELMAASTPLAMELTSDRADEFSEQVGQLASYQAMQTAAERFKAASEKQLKAERNEARLQRILATCEDVVRAANLPLAAPQEIVDRFDKLVELENGTLQE